LHRFHPKKHLIWFFCGFLQKKLLRELQHVLFETLRELRALIHQPIYCKAKVTVRINKVFWGTSGPFIAMKLRPDSVASALAISVLLQPGGPYSRIPFEGYSCYKYF
jgi:hypothetical protein